MHKPSSRRPVGLLFALPLLCASAAFAQTQTPPAQAPLEPAQLPQNTVFYVIWRGAPPASARAANNLLSLWDDAEFAPVRSGMAESLLNNSEKSGSSGPAENSGKPGHAGGSQKPAGTAKSAQEKPQLTREEIAQISSLLENPFVLGYLGEPAHSAATAGKAESANGRKKWNGIFFVYDRSGKEDLLAKTVLRLRASEKVLPKMMAVTLAGISALKIERKDSTTYWAEDGKYAISANEPAVFENIAALLKGKAQAASLAQTAAYQEAGPLVGAGFVEFFLRVPSLKELAPESGPNAAQVQMVLSALKLDAIHSVCGHLALEGAKTRITGAVLGDASPGTLFDLWEEGQAAPASLAFVPSDAVYYQESQFSLLALYKTLKRGFQASAPEGQQGMTDLVEAMVQTRIGMPLADALGLLSGEFASVQTSPLLEPKNQTYFIGIRDKQGSLKLLRTMLGDRISSERNEGEATYLKFSLGGGQGSAGVTQWNFYHLAVTPNLILASSRRETLQQAIAHHASSPAAVPPVFQAVRGQFPEKLNGISFVDFQRLDWQALKDKWLAESAKTSAALQQKSAAPPSATPPAWLLQFNPQVIPRHLHVTSSASWKDTKGIHFDGWIE